jgi:hypothetical protein
VNPAEIELVCPHCGQTFPVDTPAGLKSSGRILAAMRRVRRGRAPVVYACPCGSFIGTARQLRQHHCPLKPPRGRESAIRATRAQAEEFFARDCGGIPPGAALDLYPE